MALLDLKNLELKDKFTQFITSNVQPLTAFVLEKPLDVVNEGLANTQISSVELPDAANISNL